MQPTAIVAGAVTSGNLKGAVLGAFSAAAFHGVGTLFEGRFLAASGKGVLGTGMNSLGVALKSGAHGLTGGVMGALQGGRFGHGFLSGFATQLAAGRIDGLERGAQRVAAAAALGGTVSAVTGDKFANGAVTGAFSRASSERLHRWRLSQNAFFGGYVSLDTDIAAPGFDAAMNLSAVGVPELNVSPPTVVGHLRAVPVGSTARIDYSATGGVDASFDRREGLDGFVWGAINPYELRSLHVAFAGTALATVPAAVAASAGVSIAVLKGSPALAKAFFLSMLEAKASAVSFTNQYVVPNALRQIPTTYVPYISRQLSPQALPYPLVLPK